MTRLRPHLSYANVVSTLCLFIALGGVSYAAVALPRNSVGVKQLKRNAVTSAKVKNGSLRAIDFRRGQLPTGARGPQGERGPAGAAGPVGPAGPVDPSQFLAAGGKAADADRIDGLDSATLVRGVVVREEDSTALAGQVDGMAIECEPGETAIAGGARWHTAPADWPITESAPTSDGHWAVTVFNNDGADDRGWTGFAVCAKVG